MEILKAQLGINFTEIVQLVISCTDADHPRKRPTSTSILDELEQNLLKKVNNGGEARVDTVILNAVNMMAKEKRIEELEVLYSS